tara:strand:+ start:344 stop:565 length:222 start_codon:yes stop_codon:yes gene_type:complete
MINGLKGTHIATGYPVDIPLNGKQMQLAMDNGPHMNDLWDLMCDSVYANGGPAIIDQVEIDFIVINGIQKVFH